MSGLVQKGSLAKGALTPRRREQPRLKRRTYLAVPRFMRIAERQIDNAAEVKPLPPLDPPLTETAASTRSSVSDGIAAAGKKASVP